MEIVDFATPSTVFKLSFPVMSQSELVNIGVSALEDALGLTGYQQVEVLRIAAVKVVDKYKSFELGHVIQTLKFMMCNSESTKDSRNIDHLLERLEKFYQNCASISIIPENDAQEKSDKLITLYQISNCNDNLRGPLVTYILSILWQLVRCGKSPYDVIVIDEIQNVPFTKGTPLFSMLREGRKFGLRVLLATQYLPDKDRERNKLNALLQVGMLLVFHPTYGDIKTVNEILQIDDEVDWKPMLRTLERGYAILKAEYRVKGSTITCKRPVLVHIE